MGTLQEVVREIESAEKELEQHLALKSFNLAFQLLLNFAYYEDSYKKDDEGSLFMGNLFLRIAKGIFENSESYPDSYVWSALVFTLYEAEYYSHNTALPENVPVSSVIECEEEAKTLMAEKLAHATGDDFFRAITFLAGDLKRECIEGDSGTATQGVVRDIIDAEVNKKILAALTEDGHSAAWHLLSRLATIIGLNNLFIRVIKAALDAGDFNEAREYIRFSATFFPAVEASDSIELNEFHDRVELCGFIMQANDRFREEGKVDDAQKELERLRALKRIASHEAIRTKIDNVKVPLSQRFYELGKLVQATIVPEIDGSLMNDLVFPCFKEAADCVRRDVEETSCQDQILAKAAPLFEALKEIVRKPIESGFRGDDDLGDLCDAHTALDLLIGNNIAAVDPEVQILCEQLVRGLLGDMPACAVHMILESCEGAEGVESLLSSIATIALGERYADTMLMDGANLFDFAIAVLECEQIPLESEVKELACRAILDKGPEKYSRELRIAFQHATQTGNHELLERINQISDGDEDALRNTGNQANLGMPLDTAIAVLSARAGHCRGGSGAR